VGAERVARGSGVAREPLTGRVMSDGSHVVGSGPVGERATPTPGQDPLSLPRPLSRRVLSNLNPASGVDVDSVGRG
jgi:hypothetical protein